MIFCVEDDKSIQDLIIYSLNSVGFEAQGFSSSKNFWKEMNKQEPELIILDIMLPLESGLDILTKLKKIDRYQNIPVIMLTAKSSEYDKVKGLNLGADDYIVKPFGVMELVARIKAVLRRNIKEEKQKDKLKAANIEIDLTSHVVKIDDKIVTLTLKEYQLLVKLMQNSDRVLDRDILLEDIWGYDYFGETRTVDVHIRTLRAKLKDNARYIKTIRGVGYRFTPE